MCGSAAFALERVARDSARDHPTVMEVLSAFIREHSREPWPQSDSGSEEHEPLTRPDVQAGVTVVGRRDPERDIRRIALTNARWSPHAVVPKGWQRDTQSGRLKQVSSD
jgi:hypothetical protein